MMKKIGMNVPSGQRAYFADEPRAALRFALGYYVLARWASSASGMAQQLRSLEAAVRLVLGYNVFARKVCPTPRMGQQHHSPGQSEATERRATSPWVYTPSKHVALKGHNDEADRNERKQDVPINIPHGAVTA